MNKKLLMTTLLLILLFPFGVLAVETCDEKSVSVSSISLVDKSEYVEEIKAASAVGKNIGLDLIMFQPSDSIKYKIVLNNDSNKDYTLDDNLNVKSDYFDYTIEIPDGSNVIKGKESKEVYLSVNYKDRVPEEQFSTPVYNDVNNIVVGLSAESASGIQKIFENPKTGVFSYIPLFVFIIIFSIVSFIVIKKRKLSKFMMILVVCSLIIPHGAFARCKCELNIKSNISISKREPFLYDYSRENDGITIDEYLVKVAKTNIEYNIEDKNKCINYLTEKFVNEYEYYPDEADHHNLYKDEEEANYYATAVCSGGEAKKHYTLENYVYDMNSSNYELAGFSNVKLTARGGDAGLNVVVPTYIDGKIVKKFNISAFQNMGIKTIKLPDYLEELDGFDDNGAISGNEIETIDLPNTLKYIGPWSLSYNKIKSITIPDSVEHIAFRGLSGNGLEHVDLGHGVKIINTEAFYYNNLTTVTIPSSVTTIQSGFVAYWNYNGAFERNPLRTVYIEGKSSTDDFEKYYDGKDGKITTPFGWADDVTCVKDNDHNVTNGCIIWQG